MREADVIGIALLGLAHTAHARAYAAALSMLRGARLTGIFDDDPRRLDPYAGLIEHGTQVFASLEEALAHPGVRAVVVCCPTAQHADWVCRAAEAGKHVFCEKPLATNLKDARKMVDACARNGVLLQNAFSCRFYPILQRMRKDLEEAGRETIFAMTGGNRGIAPLDYPDWIRNPALAGGGALLDHSVHVTDAMRFVSGLEVASVFAETDRFFNPDLAVEDSAYLLLKFDNGAVGSVDPSWSLPRANPYSYDFFLRVDYDGGVFTADDRRQALWVTAGDESEAPFRYEYVGGNIDERMIACFVASVVAGRNLYPAASGEDGFRALEIALAGYASARSGRAVTLEEIQ